MRDTLYIGIGNTVVAIERSSGREIWRSSLKTGLLGGEVFTNVLLDGGELFAATAGELFRLDPATGTTLWHSELKGLGTGVIAFSEPSGQVAATETMRRAAAAAAAAVT